jgi:hypothetical protein
MRESAYIRGILPIRFGTPIRPTKRPAGNVPRTQGRPQNLRAGKQHPHQRALPGLPFLFISVEEVRRASVTDGRRRRNWQEVIRPHKEGRLLLNQPVYWTTQFSNGSFDQGLSNRVPSIRFSLSCPRKCGEMDLKIQWSWGICNQTASPGRKQGFLPG